MGFVGGGGWGVVPVFSVLLLIKQVTRYIGIIDLLFYSRLRLRFLHVGTNPGPRRPIPAACRILCSNVRGLSRNLSDLTVASSQFDILLCSETLVRDGFGDFRQPKFECGCCEILVFKVCAVRQNFYVFSLYRNPDLK